MFDLWSRASGLRLKTRKCVLFPLWEGSFNALRTVVDSVPAFAGMAISSSARYLGVIVGPGAHEVQWEAVAPKLLFRALDVAATGATLFTKVRLWGMHGCSLLACKSRFVDLSLTMLRVYRQATQRITQAPWMSFPPVLLDYGDLVGGAALRDPSRMGRASGWALIRTSSAVRCAWAEFDSAAPGDEAALLAMGGSDFPRQWRRRSSITLQLRVEKRAMEAFTILTPFPEDTTSAIYRATGASDDERRRDLDVLLRRRMARWDPETPESLMGALFSFVRIRPPLEMLCTVLRAAMYGWCTAARLRSGANRSLLGCGVAGGDCHIHYVHCARWHAWAGRVLGVGAFVHNGTTTVIRALAMEAQVSLRIALALDCLLCAVDKLRRGAPQRYQDLMQGRLKEMVRRHPALRAAALRSRVSA